MSTHLPISIIIATRNRRHLLAQTLQALAQQSWPREQFEIVIADNGSTDDTRAVIEAAAAAAGAPSITYLDVREPGKSAAVNRALSATRGDLLAFTDDDVEPEPQWLERLHAAAEETGADFVAGRILPRWEVAPPHWMSPALYGVLATPDSGTCRLPIEPGANGNVMPIGANMAVRAHVIARVGGLRTDLGKLAGTLRTGEDHEFFLRMLRAGCRGIYEPTAAVRHWVPRERLERSYCRRWLYENGRDVARIEALHTSELPRLLGVPRYLWRQVANHLWSMARASITDNAAARFAAGVRLLWFGGYVRESWFRARETNVQPQ
jgi:glycosyltransferase involved in cell wall biosynthesis